MVILKNSIPLPKKLPEWQLFAHDADMGVRGYGRSLMEAFEQSALALTSLVTDLNLIEDRILVEVTCTAPDTEMLLIDWLNAVIYEMSIRKMLFSRFEIQLNNQTLQGKLWGEVVSKTKHSPAVEPKGATFTQLKVEQLSNAIWVAQCIIDV